MNIMGMFGGGNSGYYSLIGGDGGGGQGGSGGGHNNDSTSYNPENENQINKDQAILIDFEPVENLSPIDVTKYVKCFSNVPDNGAKCSIEILVDIPVDNDPNKLLNWQTRSPGHTFLQLKKMNGGQAMMQNIGFYPESG
jgi:hypothetical protein